MFVMCSVLEQTNVEERVIVYIFVYIHTNIYIYI